MRRPDPDANGLYPHPGLWLSESDDMDLLRVRIDVAIVAPIMCRLGFHRWISTFALGALHWETRCWYCEKEKP